MVLHTHTQFLVTETNPFLPASNYSNLGDNSALVSGDSYTPMNEIPNGTLLILFFSDLAFDSEILLSTKSQQSQDDSDEDGYSNEVDEIFTSPTRQTGRGSEGSFDKLEYAFSTPYEAEGRHLQVSQVGEACEGLPLCCRYLRKVSRW